MQHNRYIPPAVYLSGAFAVGLALGFAAARAFSVGNRRVPQPVKGVDLPRFLGKWYEIGRYDNRFERGCEAATAEYSLDDEGQLRVTNSCHEGEVAGPLKTASGKAWVVDGSDNAKLKVRFFGPFAADYWVLDHGDDYSWAIVGEPSGRYLWLLCREAEPSDELRTAIEARAAAMGYDLNRLYRTAH
ncbi:MAG: lipocalin family protein [Asticcacaulis sp.]|nr:lipocalin family protein [Asticcacaulis sp.]